MEVAIIASVVPERKQLLARSLITWLRDIRFSKSHANIYLSLEGWSEDQQNSFASWVSKHHVHVRYAERSGSHIAGYNYWMERVKADVYLITHGEILFPQGTLWAAQRFARLDTYVAFKVFWMPQGFVDHLHDGSWVAPEVLEFNDDLYRLDPKEKGQEYWNVDVRGLSSWESSTTYAISADTAAKLFPFPDLGHQGWDDPYFAGLRSRLSIRTHVVHHPILFHQWHPQLWNGDHDLAVQEASRLLRERFG